MPTVLIGFIGAGGIAQAHIRGLCQISEVEIVAICDVDEERARITAAPLEAAVYADGHKLIAKEDLDALYICVPPFAHEDYEICAARKGVHLFIEKPVHLHIDRARAIWRAIREAGVLTQVGYTLRYLPVFMRLHDFLAGKEVGTAHVFRWNGLIGTPWWRRYEQSGGQLVEMTTHQVDLLRWYMGEVMAVAASYSFHRLLRDEPDVTIPDSQAVLLHFASGASATISTSCGIGKAWHGGMDFALKNARVSLQGEEIRVEPEDTYMLPPAPTRAPSIDASFTSAVLTGDRTLLKSPYDDALRSLAVTLAANRSAEEGGRLVKIAELLPEEA